MAAATRLGLVRRAGAVADHYEHGAHRTTSPSPTRIRDTVPAAGDWISTVVLSVWISTKRVVLGQLLTLPDQPAGDLSLGKALAEVGVARTRTPSARQPAYDGRPTHASAGASSTRSPFSTRQSEIACSSPRSSGRDRRGHVAELERSLRVPDSDRVRVVLVLGLRHEREPGARVEGRVGERLGPVGDTRGRDHADTGILPADEFARDRIARR